MTDVFGNNPIPCPECKPFGKNNKLKHYLECVEHNYSGTGVDIGECPECGKCWAIYYEVSRLEREPAWDGLSRVEREALELEKAKAKEEQERKLYLELQEKYGQKKR